MRRMRAPGSSPISPRSMEIFRRSAPGPGRARRRARNPASSSFERDGGDSSSPGSQRSVSGCTSPPDSSISIVGQAREGLDALRRQRLGSPRGSDELRTRTELKNMNSFNFAAKGIERESPARSRSTSPAARCSRRRCISSRETRNRRRPVRRRRHRITATSPSPTWSRCIRRQIWSSDYGARSASCPARGSAASRPLVVLRRGRARHRRPRPALVGARRCRRRREGGGERAREPVRRDGLARRGERGRAGPARRGAGRDPPRGVRRSARKGRGRGLRSCAVPRAEGRRVAPASSTR